MKNLAHGALLVLIGLILLTGCDRNSIGPSPSDIDNSLPPSTTIGRVYT